MRTLCAQADYILPNLTEACYLTDTPYESNAPVERIMQALQNLCPSPILTGIDDGTDISVHYILNGKTCKYSTQKIDGFFHGTGDVFASAFVGAITLGKRQERAIRLASDFTTASVRRTQDGQPDKRYGLLFEQEIFSLIKNLNDGSIS